MTELHEQMSCPRARTHARRPMTDQEFQAYRQRSVVARTRGPIDPAYRGPDDGWSDRAACKGVPVAIFYPKEAWRPSFSPIMEFCAGCPVAGECLAWALRTEEFGYWAGTSPDERARLRLVLGIEFTYETPYRARVVRKAKKEAAHAS